MSTLQETAIHCPYCGETINVLIDNSVPQQNYIEDCQVCCQPINFAVSINDDGQATVAVAHEDE